MNALFARRPPLWQATCAISALWAVGLGVMRWVDHFRLDPSGEDIRVWIVAARIGVSHGWQHIYDLSLEQAFSSGLGPSAVIDSDHLFLAPPPTAWAMLPIAGLPVATAFLIWTLVSLIAFGAAEWLVCPGSRFVKIGVLLTSLAVWPVHYQFWLGQWVAVTIATLAVTWWLLEHGRWSLAGVMLGVALCAKPQDIWLVPIALLASGRWKPFVSFAATAGFLAAISWLAIGPSGAAAWLHDITLSRNDPANASLTYSSLFGEGQAATAAEIAMGIGALALAWYRRGRLDLVFALGVVGTTASASYLHEYDVAILVLPAWIILREGPSVALRIWLVAGVMAAQFIAIGLPIPILLWEPGWTLLLGLEPRLTRHSRQTAELAFNRAVNN